jgi:metallo-beta-lactamase family protein
VTGGAIVLAGSGMAATGGRVLHHLRHNLSRPQSAVVFVAYAAAGTLAGQIIDGADEVTISGKPIRVRARIHPINGFSAHADQPELLTGRRRADPKRMFLTHGEEPAVNAFVAKLEGAHHWSSQPARMMGYR